MKRIKFLFLRWMYLLYDKIRYSPLIEDFLYTLTNRSQFTKLSSHEEMLADKQRNLAYHKAISKYVKEGDTVIDIGTGTGILSFFCSPV